MASKLGEKLYQWTHPPPKRVYTFNEGSVHDAELLGSKGANLCEMYRLDLPVPEGFIITTEACRDYYNTADPNNTVSSLSAHFVKEYSKVLKRMEAKTGRTFGTAPPKGGSPPKPTNNTDINTSSADGGGGGGASSTDGAAARRRSSSSTPVIAAEYAEGSNSASDEFPMLLSVRSGAATKIPGMMQTILNVGMNDSVVQTMGRMTNNLRWAYDCQQRYLRAFGVLVYKVPDSDFQEKLDDVFQKTNCTNESQFSCSELMALIQHYKAIVDVPHEPRVQLQLIIEAMFNSWNSPAAREFRDVNNVSNDTGTAVVVQVMVFGNFNSMSGSGLLFTRHPITGEDSVFGEYLNSCEGLDLLASERKTISLPEMRVALPDVHRKLLSLSVVLERNYKDMLQVEFTVENGVLFILESIAAQRSPRAAVRVAVAMVQEKIITEREALMQLDAEQLDFFIHPSVDINPVGDLRGANEAFLGRGIGRSCGAVSGVAVFCTEDAIDCAARGQSCILFKTDVTPQDAAGLQAASALVVAAASGGERAAMHAASVMHGLGKPVVQCCASHIGPTCVSHQITRNALSARLNMRHSGIWNQVKHSNDNILVIDDGIVSGHGARVWQCRPPAATRTAAAASKAATEAVAGFVHDTAVDAMHSVAAAIMPKAKVDPYEDSDTSRVTPTLTLSGGDGSSRAEAGGGDWDEMKLKSSMPVGKSTASDAVLLEEVAKPSPKPVAPAKPMKSFNNNNNNKIASNKNSSSSSIHNNGSNSSNGSGTNGAASNKDRTIISRGDVVTVDGSSGCVYWGRTPTQSNVSDHYFQQIMQWSDKYKHILVMANGCSAEDVKVAIAMGAEGVGSFEMKSLFFSTLQHYLPPSMDPNFGSTITSSGRGGGDNSVAVADLVREKMLTTCKGTRTRIIRELRGLLTQQLVTVFKACPNKEITCRLADANLQDFFPSIYSPTFEADVLAISFRLKLDPVHCLRVVRSLHEEIPSLGYKGARQAVTHPEICLMQCRAIMDAAFATVRSGSATLKPQILIPFVSSHREVEILLPLIRSACDEVCADNVDMKLEFAIGCSLETPSACLTAEKVANIAGLDFVSFACCQLTALSLGVSRTDSNRTYMHSYLKQRVYAKDPFQSLNHNGVGSLINMAVEKCRKVNPQLTLGISGRLCGDPASIEFYDKMGVNFVSCAARRVPVAKVAAAQAQIVHSSSHEKDWGIWLYENSVGPHGMYELP